MNLRKGICSFFLLFAVVALHAQATAVFTEANLAYKRGVDFFNQSLYGLAQKEFRTAIDLLRPVNEPEWKAVKTDAELYYAKSAVRLGQPEAEKITLDFLRENSPSPVASQAALEIGDYYFNNKQYDKALTYYDMAPSSSGATRDEIRFKQGYSYFVTKQFPRAKNAFAPLKENTRGDWYYPANYYYGCCAFFEGKYDEAAKAFVRCEQSEKYKQLVPYYIAQIYAAKKQYDLVISYGEPKTKADIKNRSEMNQLVGQAYYEKGDYKRAMPYLEYAANNGVNIRPADFYQLGYAQYQNGYYKQAINNFEQLSKQDSLLGQNGLYHLGDSYLKTNNKFNARNAFGQAAAMNYDRTVKEDALFNYAKLSYELKYDRDAIEALQKFTPASKYYEDAQGLMSEVFLNTRDYDRALTTLEAIKNRTPKLNETYQKVAYLRGLQLYQNNQKAEARTYFNKSLENPLDKRTAALSSFWMGALANESSEFNISQKHIAAFLAQAKAYNDLPDESNIAMGQYIQGYNYLKLKDYKNALVNFKASVDGIKRNLGRSDNEQIKTAVLGDAVLRAGDCHFKNNQYNEALAYYNEAVNKKYSGFEYALYQKAIIKGLQNSPLDKVVALENLVNTYPNSSYTDEALYELGSTYQDMGKLDQAVPPFKRLVADFRGRSTFVNLALLKLGLISYNQGSATTAINYYKQVFANNPENQEAKEALAALEEIYVKDLNQPDQYFAFVETVPGYNVTTSSKDSVTYYSAEIQYQNRRYPQAIEGFTNYLAKYQSGRYTLSAYYYRAESYMASDPSKAQIALKDYATIVSRGASKFYSKAAEKGAALAMNNTRDYPQALDFARKWEQSATTESARLSAQLVAIEAAYRTNNATTVGEYATKISASGLASPDQIAYANFYTAKLAYDKNDFARAYPAFQSVTRNTTGDIMPESYHLLAQILYKQRKYSEGEDLITEANKASAGYDDWIARNLILLSDIYADQNDKNSATAALEAVIENYKGDDPTIVATARQKYAKLNGAAPVMNSTQKGGNLLDVEEGGN